MIHSTTIIKALDNNKQVFQGLFTGVQEDVFRWKPLPDKWNLLEILCHLYDEEREDFRARVKSVLNNPALPLNPINPVAWVEERQYASQNYKEKLSSFLSEREQSIEWLTSLPSPQWSNIYQHPKLGSVVNPFSFSSLISIILLQSVKRQLYQFPG